MLAVERSALRLKTAKRERTYSSFSDARKTRIHRNVFSVELGENCRIESGVLCTGIGIEPYLLGSGDSVAYIPTYPDPKAFFTFLKDVNGKQENVLGCITTEGDFCVYKGGGFALVKQFQTETQAVVVGDAERGNLVALIGGAGLSVYDVNREMTVTRSTKAFLPFGCAAEGRLFCAVAPNIVAYFAAYDLLNTDAKASSAGEIRLPETVGKIVAITRLGKYVLVFCEYGILRLDVRGDVRQFKIERMEYRGGRIFENSVCAFNGNGERVVFLTEDGVCVLEQKTARLLRLEMPVLPKRQGQVCVHGFFNGQYVLSFLAVDDAKRCVVVNPVKETAYTSFTPDCLCVVDGQAACIYDKKLYRFCDGGIYPKGSAARFFSSKTDFGVMAKKQLHSVTVVGSGMMALGIDDGNGDVLYEADLQQRGRAVIKTSLCADTFAFRGLLGQGARLQEIVFRFSTLKGVEERGKGGAYED